MKTFKVFMEGKKSCPPGQYWCHTDKKCKKIPKGHHVGRRGYLEKDEDDENESNGNSNGNGGNGHGGNGNGGGGNGGGGE